MLGAYPPGFRIWPRRFARWRGALLVEFVISVVELRRVNSELKANRREYRDSDVVDILVSEFAATFRSIGTEAEAPVEGKSPGTVRIPLRIVDKIIRIAPSLKKRKLHFQCAPGVVRIGTFSLKHPDIESGQIPDQGLQIPIDASVLDTLAISEILGPAQIVQEGMRSRVEDAMAARGRAISAALEALDAFGITKAQIQRLIEASVTDAAARLRSGLRSR
jgi:hypothetical protein